MSAILCRAFGHKTYTHPHIVWRSKAHQPYGFSSEGTPVIITRCKRCGRELARRPMLAGEDTIEA